MELLNALVLDDAFSPPRAGAVAVNDKNEWLDFVDKSKEVQNVLLQAFSALEATDIDVLLEALTAEEQHLVSLWRHHEANTLPEANLALLFKSFVLHRTGKLEKPLAVCQALEQFVAKDRLRTFWKIDDIVGATDHVDVAFIDFYLDDNEAETAALQRIRNYREHLAKVKLLFFMSSRASIELQRSVRSILGMRTAFFDVLTKTDVNTDLILSKIRERKSTYIGNRKLEDIVRTLVSATKGAAEEFLVQCDDLEVHDLRLLNLARLAAEGESISKYLTWLASESIAAKIRRISFETLSDIPVDQGSISVSGQATQSKVLFELFSDVIFGPAQPAGSHLQFGEVLTIKAGSQRLSKAPALKRRAVSEIRSTIRSRHHLRTNQREYQPESRSMAMHWHAPNRYLLVLTPACDLVRCSPSKNVLCVVGIAEDLSKLKDQISEKLYGKHKQGLRHLLNAKGPGAPILITWQKDQTLMLPLRELIGGTYRRVAQMNELYAHEVKEEVLRQLGRVGTQIDPPPPFALHAQVRWKTASNSQTLQIAETEKDGFYAAVLSYAEQGEDKYPVAILSAEFQRWAISKIEASMQGQATFAKLENCVNTLRQNTLFTLKKNLTHKGELQVRLKDEENENLNSFVVDIALSL